MTDKPTKSLRSGRPRSIHGGYSFLLHGIIPERRRYILAYLTDCRAQLCEDHGGEDSLSAAQTILIDRVISKLGCLRLIEEHCKDHGVMVAGEIQPSLQKNYLAFSNSLRLDLTAIKELAASNSHPAQTVQDLMAEFDANKDRENSEVGQGEHDAGAVK